MNQLLDNNKEYKKPLEPTDIMFFIGAITSLVNDAIKNPQDFDSLNRLRYIMSIFTLPLDFLPANLSDEPVLDLQNAFMQYCTVTGVRDERAYNFLKIDNDIFANKFVTLAFQLRKSEFLTWIDEVDWELTETMLGERPLDTESRSGFGRVINGKQFIRWTFPLPETYWQTTDVNKLLNVVVALIEELVHLCQKRENKIHIYSLNFDFNIAGLDEVLIKLVERLMESDVTALISLWIPEVLSENWHWYLSRSKEKSTEKHFPLTFGFLWGIGYLLSEFTDQKVEFVYSTLTGLGEFLSKNFNNVRYFFSNYISVCGGFVLYMKLISNDLSLEKDKLDALKAYTYAELQRQSLFYHFIRYCLYLRDIYGSEWKLHLYPENDEYGEVVMQEYDNIFKSTVNLFNSDSFLFLTFKEYFDTSRSLSRKKQILTSLGFGKKFKFNDFDEILDELSAKNTSDQEV